MSAASPATQQTDRMLGATWKGLIDAHMDRCAGRDGSPFGRGGSLSAPRSALVASGSGGKPSIPERATGRRFPPPGVLIGGLVGGLIWGVDGRVWMRFISTDPEFTWAGTLFIVIGFGIAGLGQAGAYLGRRASLRRSRMTVLRVATFSILLPL